jgi:cellulose synthase/poly-beta-1,6-N-acetylglucosamine synthase-like glycosyltransferase
MKILFWASVLFVAYVYAGYPLLLAIWARVANRPVQKGSATDRFDFPTVSIVVAARNEGPRLPARVANLLEQNYPRLLDIVVVSDGSTDNTREALAPFGERIRLIELPRGGKPLALNAGVAAARGEIIVFADARQRFAPDATLALVSNFADPTVGAVTGELILDCELHAGASDSTMAEGVGLYWKYEKWLRRHESCVWSTLGATGAIYAMRRSLWEPLPHNTLLDDVMAPMRVVLGGRRVVFDERARAFDRVAPTGQVESHRKIRTLAGNYQILALEARLLLPVVNPVWLQYYSHKVGRLLVPWALLTTLVSGASLADSGWPYALALLLQLCFYGLAAFGGWMESRCRTTTVRTEELPVASDHPGPGLGRGFPLSGGMIAAPQGERPPVV